jgi:hypothetical protein
MLHACHEFQMHIAGDASRQTQPASDPVTRRDSLNPLFFAYCSSHLKAPVAFDPRNIAGGIHIPTMDESAAITKRGGEFLQHLKSISMGIFPQENGPELKGPELFADVWRQLTPVQKDFICEEKCPERDACIQGDHPFVLFKSQFQATGETNVHLLTRVFGRLIDDNGYHQAWMSFENLLTGTAQVLICPITRWYVPVTRLHGAKPTFAEITESGTVFKLKDEGRWLRQVVEVQDARLACPFFTHLGPQRCIQKWNGKRGLEDLDKLRDVSSGQTAALKNTNRSHLYHYSGVSAVVEIEPDESGNPGRVEFVTAGLHGNKTFTEWQRWVDDKKAEKAKVSKHAKKGGRGA